MLQELLTFSDLQHFIAIKFCFFAFLVVSIVVLYKKWNPWWILLLASGLSAFAYTIFVQGHFLPLWGLKGDEVTIAAMYNTFAHTGFFTDFSYHNLPPFYPPLFFWIFALPGKIFNWNGVQIVKFASFVSVFLFPLLVYGIQKWYAHVTPATNEEKLPTKISWIFAPLLMYAFLDWDAIIGKPYEMITAALSVLWIVYLVQDIFHKRLTNKKVGVYAVAGGLLFMTYYLWLVFGAIAVALSGLFVKKLDQKYFYGRLFLVGCFSLLIASPYLFPLIRAYHTFGSENWQIAFFVLEKLPPALDFLHIDSWRSLFLLSGFMILLLYRKNLYIRTLLLLLISAYIWYLMGLSTLFGFAAPMQEFKGFYFFDRTVLAFAAAFGIVELWKYIETKTANKNWQLPTLILGVCVLSTYLFFGNFIDNPKIQERRVENKTVRPTLSGLIQFLQTDATQKSQPMTLSSGIPEIPAFVPLNQFIYYNQFNSHPGAEFSRRKAYLTWLQTAKSSEELYTFSRDSWFGSIDQYILFQDRGSDKYNFYLYVDDFPRGAKEEIIQIPKSLIAEPFFTKSFENYEFVVWKRNAEIKK